MKQRGKRKNELKEVRTISEIPAFLYINNEKNREIKETIPFTIATKIIKCLGIYLPKETKTYI